MAALEKITKAAPTRSLHEKVGRFILHFLELQIPMVIGATICYLVGRFIPATSAFALVYHPGTYLYAAGDILFLTVPVVVWMIIREHAWRNSLEMATAMLAPVTAISLLGQLEGYPYLLWLVTAMYPAMCLGMLVYMLYRRDHFIHPPVQSLRSVHQASEPS